MNQFKLRRLGLSDDSGQYRPNLQACLEAVLEQSPLLMDTVLSGLRQALQPALGRTVAQINDAITRATVDALLAQRVQLMQSFDVHLRIAVYGGQGGPQAERQVLRFDDFQFLDAEQIDANIEFAQSQQNVLRAVEDVLPAFNAMLSHLLGWSSVQAHLNPLKPEAFVLALREALSECLPDRAARAVVMDVASGLLGVNLHHLYTETTDWLRSQGVEAVHMAASKSTGLWNPANAKEGTVERTILTLDKLRRLLSGDLNPEAAGSGQLDFSQTIPASFEALQDMKLVEPMLKRLADRAAAAGQATRPLGAGQPGGEGDLNQRRQLGALLGREVVALMLDKLMQDRRLLPAVRASLKQLEPALCTLSLQDGRFFSERTHPARMFLDGMTHRSLAYTSDTAPGYARFQRNFDGAVKALLAGPGDAASFAQVLRTLEAAWVQDEAQIHQRAADAARGLLQAEQRNLLAQRLANQFSERIGKRRLPSVVVGFLYGPWAQVVAQAQLNCADGSADPEGYLALVDDLIWSVRPRLTRHNRPRLVRLVPEMLVKLRRGLLQISYPEARIATFFDGLIAFHEQAFDVARPAPTEPASDASTASREVADFWMAESEAADSGFLNEDTLTQSVQPSQPSAMHQAEQGPWTVDSLGVGCWVDLALAGNWVRAQLSWTSPQRSLFLFVSGSGLTHSMSRQSVERLQAAALIRLVSDGRVMDNALDAVAQTALDNELRKPPGNLPQ